MGRVLIIGGQKADIADIDISINGSIADVREPGKRSGDWSHTVVLPGTPANRKIFSHIYELNLDIDNAWPNNFSPAFNPNIRADAEYYIEDELQLEGVFRLHRIRITDHDTIEFEGAIFGSGTQFWLKGINAKLSDLDFTEYNHILNYTNLSESWDTRIQKNGGNYTNFSGGLPTGEGYLYALIDDGSLVNYYQNTNLSQFYPALYLKEVWDKCFDYLGFTTTDDSFDKDQYFKNIVIPCPTGMHVGDEERLDYEFEANHSSGQVTVYNGTNSNHRILEFTNQVFDTTSNYNQTSSYFTSPVSGGKFDFHLEGNISVTGLTANTEYWVFFYLEVSGVVTQGTPGMKGTYTSVTSDGSGNVTSEAFHVWFTVDGSTYPAMQYGNQAQVGLYGINPFQNNGGNPSSGIVPPACTVTIDAGATFYNKTIDFTWGQNVLVNFDFFFTEDIKIIEFLKSVFNAFNLYAEPVLGSTTQLFIQTRDSFYRDNTIDLSQRLDISQPLDITPMGELAGNPYLFKYADGSDEDNETYQQAYRRTYGDKKYFVDNDFIKTEEKIELIFAPSHMWADDKILTRVMGGMDKGTGQLRLLIYGGLGSCPNYLIFNDSDHTASGGATARKTYPLTLHIDDPDDPTEDLNFGFPFRVNRPIGSSWTNNNLFNKYWRNYITEITDPNSDIVGGWFNITPDLFANLSFRDVYFFENAYFYLNRYSDYNPKEEALTYMEFLRVKNAIGFTPGTAEIGTDLPDVWGDKWPRTKGVATQDNPNKQPGVIVGNNNTGDGGGHIILGNNVSVSKLSGNTGVMACTDVVINPGVDGSLIAVSSDYELATSNSLVLFNENIVLANLIPQVIQLASGDMPYLVASAGSLEGHYIFVLDMSAGTGTITLPEISTCPDATWTFFINAGGTHNVTINAGYGELINGATGTSFNTLYGKITIRSIGTKFIIIG